MAGSHQVLDIVIDNWHVLREANLLEAAFIEAWSKQKHGVHNWTNAFCRAVFAELNRSKLLIAGDPLPAGDFFTVYRGVAGVGIKRRVHGYSWTSDLDIAKGFAERLEQRGLADPGVYRAVIAREKVLAYLDASHREEREFLLLPKHLSKIERIT